jgi:hypothetical protein
MRFSLVDLAPWANGAEWLHAAACAQLLGEVAAAAAAQRLSLQRRVDVYAWHVAYGDGAAWATALEAGPAAAAAAAAAADADADAASRTHEAAAASSGDPHAAASKWLDPVAGSEAALRLRLLEHTCASLRRTFPSAQPPSGAGSRSRGDAVAKWKGAATAARVDHGVWVSLPALLLRAHTAVGALVPTLAPDALPRRPPEASLPEAAPGGPAAAASAEAAAAAAESTAPRLPRAAVVAALRACVAGGYEARLCAMARLFEHACEPPDDGALNCALAEAAESGEVVVPPAEVPPALAWPEMEAVLRVCAEAAALALRDELLAFTAVNPADPVHQVSPGARCSRLFFSATRAHCPSSTSLLLSRFFSKFKPCRCSLADHCLFPPGTATPPGPCSPSFRWRRQPRKQQRRGHPGFRRRRFGVWGLLGRGGGGGGGPRDAPQSDWRVGPQHGRQRDGRGAGG